MPALVKSINLNKSPMSKINKIIKIILLTSDFKTLPRTCIKDIKASQKELNLDDTEYESAFPPGLTR